MGSQLAESSAGGHAFNNLAVYGCKRLLLVLCEVYDRAGIGARKNSKKYGELIIRATVTQAFSPEVFSEGETTKSKKKKNSRKEVLYEYRVRRWLLF